MRKSLRLLFILPFFMFLLFFLAKKAECSTIQNKYIVVTVDDETGRLFLSTLEGRPDVKGDEKKNLLFYDEPPSSYTIIYVDDDIFTFGSDIGQLKAPVVDTGSIKIEWRYQLISVVQEVSFVRRSKSKIEDGVLIKYSIKNLDNKKHKLGARILLDTYLGEMCKYHFEISNKDKLMGETRFDRDNIPYYWISKDKQGVVCLRGVLKGDLVVTPDRVIFANYKALSEILKNYQVRRSKDFDYPPYSRNDSAVALYYEPKVVDPNDMKVISTIVGLCGNEKYGNKREIIEEVVPQKKEENIQGGKKEKKKVYNISNYSKFKNEVSNLKILQKDITSMDFLLKEIDGILDKRDSGENINSEEIRKIEDAMKAR